MKKNTFWIFPDEEYFNETTTSALLYNLSKLYKNLIGFVFLLLLSECLAEYAVAEMWLLICLI